VLVGTGCGEDPAVVEVTPDFRCGETGEASIGVGDPVGRVLLGLALGNLGEEVVVTSRPV
jgi:hypothetical protein